MGNLYNEKRNEIQEILKNEYDIMQEDPTKQIRLEPRDVFIETASQAILKAYNSKQNTDIQKELRAYLEPTILEKIAASLDGKDIDKVKKEEQKEIQREISSVEEEGISVDTETKEEIEKNIEEKEQGKENQEVNLRAEVLKAMYKSVLEEYYKLKLDLQEGYNGQLSTGDISVGDKQGTKLVLYEKYLRNIDQRFKGISKSYIVTDDPDIKKYEQRLEKRALHNEKNVLEKADDNIQVIQKYYDERAEIATQIAWLSENASITSPEKFKTQMDELQKRYLQATAKLYAISPNPIELQKSIEERGEDEKYRAKQLGAKELAHDRRLGTAAKDISNDKRLEEVVTDSKEQAYESTIENYSAANSVYESYMEAEERGQYDKAEELLQSLEEIAGIEHEEKEIKEEKNTEENPAYDYDGEENVEQKGSNTYLNYLKGRVNDEDKTAEITVSKQDRKERLKAVLQKMPEFKEKVSDERSDIGDIGYVRKRF